MFLIRTKCFSESTELFTLYEETSFTVVTLTGITAGDQGDMENRENFYAVKTSVSGER